MSDDADPREPHAPHRMVIEITRATYDRLTAIAVEWNRRDEDDVPAKKWRPSTVAARLLELATDAAQDDADE